jgi:Flp pilus assembly protein TadG
VKHRERGVATIEAAIGIPLLLFLMFAAVELGRAYVQYTVLADASRNAIRHVAEMATRGTQRVTITDPLIAAARNLVVYGNEAGTGTAVLPGLQPNQITVVDAGNNNVQITSAYPYQPLFGPQLPTFRNGAINSMFTMSIVVTMRAL